VHASSLGLQPHEELPVVGFLVPRQRQGVDEDLPGRLGEQRWTLAPRGLLPWTLNL